MGKFTDSTKILLGGLLFVVGTFLLLSSRFTTPTATKAAGSDDLTTDWTASQVVVLTTPGLQNTQKKSFAIGPYQWDVVVKDANSNTVYTETWRPQSDAQCYVSPTVCEPGGAVQGDWMFGYYDTGTAQVSKITTGHLNPLDPSLFLTGGRGEGQGQLCQGTGGNYCYVSTGSYGWIFGEWDNLSSKSTIRAGGILMPLKWHVVGNFQ